MITICPTCGAVSGDPHHGPLITDESELPREICRQCLRIRSAVEQAMADVLVKLISVDTVWAVVDKADSTMNPTDKDEILSLWASEEDAEAYVKEQNLPWLKVEEMTINGRPRPDEEGG